MQESPFAGAVSPEHANASEVRSVPRSNTPKPKVAEFKDELARRWKLPPFVMDTANSFELPEPPGITFRSYQVAAVREAVYHNTLCCLPTGTGKTLIATGLIHNFRRWFATGKVSPPTPPAPTHSVPIL